MSPKPALRRPAFTRTAGTCKGVEQEEKKRIQHKQQASWKFSAWREWTAGLLPKRLDGDQLPSETVMIEVLSTRMALKSTNPQWRGARGEKTHPSQAASFVELFNIREWGVRLLPKWLEGDQLLSESVVIEILSIRTQGREKTHSAQAASFLEFHSMQEVKWRDCSQSVLTETTCFQRQLWLRICPWGWLWRVKGGYVSQSVVEEISCYVHSRDLQGRGARGEKTHPAQAASFPAFLNMKGVRLLPKWLEGDQPPSDIRDSCNWDLVHKDARAFKSGGLLCLSNHRWRSQLLKSHSGGRKQKSWAKRNRRVQRMKQACRNFST